MPINRKTFTAFFPHAKAYCQGELIPIKNISKQNLRFAIIEWINNQGEEWVDALHIAEKHFGHRNSLNEGCIALKNVGDNTIWKWEFNWSMESIKVKNEVLAGLLENI